MFAKPTRQQIAEINRQRLGDWGERFIAQNATPMLALGVGHGEHEGELHVCIPEGLCPDWSLVLLIRKAASLIEEEITKRAKK